MNIGRLLVFGALICFCSVGFAQPASVIDPSVISAIETLSPQQKKLLLERLKAQDTGALTGLMQENEAYIEDSSDADRSRGEVESAELSIKDSADDSMGKSRAQQDPNMRYGADLFNREISTFAPTNDAPVPSDYRLGVGDQLIVRTHGSQRQSYAVDIGRDGRVSLPGVGDLYLAGLTLEDGSAVVKQRLERELIGVEALVTLGGLRSITIFMSGEVANPGAFTVSALTTLTQALYQAGGITEIGAYRNIVVKRGGEQVVAFDLYDLLLSGDATNDIRLRSGDVVFVPPYTSLVEILGEVNRPMRYELLPGETVEDAIKMAANFKAGAYRKNAVLERVNTESALAEVYTLDLTSEKDKSMTMLHGDMLTIMRQGDVKLNAVELQGAFYRPGLRGWFRGMRLSDLIKDPVADLLPTADLDLGLIKRVDPVSLKVSVVPFQLMVALEYPGSPQDPLLEDRDTLILFARPDLERDEPGINSRAELLGPIIKEFRSQASDTSPIALVSISGGVKAPGTYPLFNGATVGDLIGFAGGLRDSAFARAAELRRLVSRNDESLGVTYQELDLSKADSGDWNRILSSRDHVTVRSIPNWSPIDRIVVEGEVAFPGEYLVQDGETLASVIERAGGLTSEAFPEGAVFIRKEVAEQERRRLRDFASKIRRNFASRMLTQEQPTSSIAEIADIVDELDNVEGLGRVLIDLKGALAGDKSANINVVDADQIIIPKRTQVVTVVGEVREQGNHSFEANLSLDDYLALSAGLTDRADEQSIYIIRPNGSVSMASSSWWRFSGRAQLIAPGDTIVVPVNTQYQETLVAWREVTQIIYQGVVTIAALGSL